MSYTYKYARPMVTVDIALLNQINNTTQILLIQRKNNPFKNKWVLPGGFVDEHEDLKDAANRELYEETSISNMPLQQFKTYGKPGRDPRGHTITILYIAVISDPSLQPKAADDAKQAKWYDLNSLPELAFDHSDIIKEVVNKISPAS